MLETKAKHYCHIHMGNTPVAKNMLERVSVDFAKETCDQACKEFEDLQLHLSYVTSSIRNAASTGAARDCFAIAVYETTESHVFLIILHTKKVKRGQGVCRDLIKELQSENSNKKLVLETRKYSEEHAIFEMMGFCSVSAAEFDDATTAIRLDSDDSPVILEYNPKGMETPPEMVHTRSILKQLNDSGHCISEHVEAYEANLEEGVEPQKDALNKMQERLPNLIDFGYSWFFRVAGKEYCDWLHFQLKKIHMELWKNKSSRKDLGKRMRSKWLLPEAGYAVERFNPIFPSKKQPFKYIDLMLLNRISNVSGLCFISVSMNRHDELVLVKPPASGSNNVSNIHILHADLEDCPRFLLTPNIDWVLQLLPSSGAVEKHASIRQLVKFLAPQPSAGQAASNPDKMVATSIVLSIPSTQAPPMSSSSRKPREDGLVVFSGGKICPSLLAIGSGIALTTNGEVCHTPLPSINRPLSSDRISQVMPSIEKGYKSEEKGEGMKEQLSLFPYNWSCSASALDRSGWELQDPANAEIDSIAGKLIASPLDAKSIQRLMKAFSLTLPTVNANMEAGTKNYSHLLEEPEGRLELLSLSLLAIQAEFQMFRTEESFQKLRVHLLLVWQKEQAQQQQQQQQHNNSRKSPQLVDSCSFTSTAGCVLLIKMLWVALGFPVLGPVEGLARLYCANDLLLHNKGLLPPGLAHAGPNVDFVGLSRGLIVEDEEDGLVAFKDGTCALVSRYAIKCQDRMSAITLLGLKDIMHHCCESILLDSKLLQKAMKTPKTSIQKVWTSSMKSQAEKLATLLGGIYKQTKGGFLEQHFSGGTSQNTNWNAKLKQLRPSSTLKGKLPVTVLVFRFMLAPLHLQLDRKKVVCKTPFESISQFILSNGEKNPRHIWWIPDANQHQNGRNGSLSWLVQFEDIILQTLVDLMATAFAYRYLNEKGVTQAQKKKRKVFEDLLKLWLHSYLLELVCWGGMNIAKPEKLHQELQFLFNSVAIDDKNQDLVSLASKLKQCQQEDFLCNLYGVVTYVLLYIESMDDMSFVQGFEAGAEENSTQDWDALIQKACPLFQGQTESEKDKKWSMFELTKWLLSDFGSSLEAPSIKGALSRCQRGDIRGQLDNFVQLGILKTDKKKDLFLEILVGQTEEQQYCGFKKEVKYIMSQEQESLYPTVWDPDGEEIEFYLLEKLSHNWMFLGNVPKKILEPIVKHCKSKGYEEAFDKMRVMKICHLGPVGPRRGFKTKDCNGKVFMSHDGSYDSENGCEKKLCQQVVDGLHNIRCEDVELIQDMEVQSFGTVGHVADHLPSKNATRSTSKRSKSKEEEEEDKGFLCVMPLDEAGCTFHMHMQEGVTEDVEVTVLYIPYGFMLVFDDREYRGGHYAPSSTNKTFICRVGTSSSNSNGREDCFALVHTPCNPQKPFPVSMKILNDEIRMRQEKYELQKEDEKVREVHALVGEGVDSGIRSVIGLWGSFACFDAYACSRIPHGIMANAIQYLRSAKFQSQFVEGMSQTESKDWNTCIPMPGGSVKGQYYEFGGNLYSEDQSGDTTPEVQPIVDHLKSQLSTMIQCNLHWSSYMVIATVQPSHQLYHVDYPPIFHKTNQKKKAFLCFIPLEKTGYTIRLAQLSSQARQKVKSRVKTQTELVFFEMNEKAILDAHVYVHVPFGDALILDVREFHGGHYINKNDLCLLCVLSAFPWNEDSKKHTFTFLRTFLPHPKTEAKDVHGHHDMTTVGQDYLKEFDKSMEAAKQPSAGDKNDDMGEEDDAKVNDGKGGDDKVIEDEAKEPSEEEEDVTKVTDGKGAADGNVEEEPSEEEEDVNKVTDGKGAADGNVEEDKTKANVGKGADDKEPSSKVAKGNFSFDSFCYDIGDAPGPDNIEEDKTKANVGKGADDKEPSSKAEKGNSADSSCYDIGDAPGPDNVEEDETVLNSSAGSRGKTKQPRKRELSVSWNVDVGSHKRRRGPASKPRPSSGSSSSSASDPHKNWSICWDCDYDNPDVKLVVVTEGRSPNRSYHTVASPITAIVTKGALTTSHQVTTQNIVPAHHIGKEVSEYYTAVMTKATNNSAVETEESQDIQGRVATTSCSHSSSILVLREHLIHQDEQQKEDTHHPIEGSSSNSAEIARAPPNNFNDAVSFVIERGEKVSTTQEGVSFAKWSFHLNWNETPQPCHLEWLRWPARYLWEVATTKRNAPTDRSIEKVGFTACRVDLYEIKDEVTQDFPELGAALGPDTITGTMIFIISNGPPSGTEELDQSPAKRQKTLKFPAYYLVITFHKEDLCGSLLKDLTDSLLKDLTKNESEFVESLIENVNGTPETTVIACVGNQHVGNQHITLSGFKTLKTLTWVNDEVITCYATLLLQTNTKESGAFHIYDANFYRGLKNGNDGSFLYTPDVHRSAYRNVPHGDLFRLQKILVPINVANVHWLCAVIYIQRKEIQVYDSLRNDDCGRQVMDDLLRFLEAYHSSEKSKKYLDEPAFDRNEWSLRDTETSTPQQQNSIDCGVFTCLFLEFLSLGITEIPPLHPKDIDICRLKIGLALTSGTPILRSFRIPLVANDPRMKLRPVFLNSGLSQLLHKQFASLLSDNEKFEKGSPYGDFGVAKMAATYHSDAKFYVGDKFKSGTKVRLLDDGQSFGTLGETVHKLEDEPFKQLFKLFSLHGYEFDMMTIRRSQKMNVISGFKPHKDKAYFEKGVAFVSLGVPFWTVINTIKKDPNDCTNTFKDWVGSVDEDQQKVLDDFMKQFDSECCSIYHCTATTVLAFKASALKHGTIIPASHHDRYVCILNELLQVK